MGEVCGTNENKNKDENKDENKDKNKDKDKNKKTPSPPGVDVPISIGISLFKVKRLYSG